MLRLMPHYTNWLTMALRIHDSELSERINRHLKSPYLPMLNRWRVEGLNTCTHTARSLSLRRPQPMGAKLHRRAIVKGQGLLLPNLTVPRRSQLSTSMESNGSDAPGSSTRLYPPGILPQVLRYWMVVVSNPLSLRVRNRIKRPICRGPAAPFAF